MFLLNDGDCGGGGDGGDIIVVDGGVSGDNSKQWCSCLW